LLSIHSFLLGPTNGIILGPVQGLVGEHHYCLGDRLWQGFLSSADDEEREGATCIYALCSGTQDWEGSAELHDEYVIFILIFSPFFNNFFFQDRHPSTPPTTSTTNTPASIHPPLPPISPPLEGPSLPPIVSIPARFQHIPSSSRETRHALWGIEAHIWADHLRHTHSSNGIEVQLRAETFVAGANALWGWISALANKENWEEGGIEGLISFSGWETGAQMLMVPPEQVDIQM
jgi:hypothetical protein